MPIQCLSHSWRRENGSTLSKVPRPGEHEGDAGAAPAPPPAAPPAAEAAAAPAAEAAAGGHVLQLRLKVDSLEQTVTILQHQMALLQFQLEQALHGPDLDDAVMAAFRDAGLAQ